MPPISGQLWQLWVRRDQCQCFLRHLTMWRRCYTNPIKSVYHQQLHCKPAVQCGSCKPPLQPAWNPSWFQGSFLATRIHHNTSIWHAQAMWCGLGLLPGIFDGCTAETVTHWWLHLFEHPVERSFINWPVSSMQRVRSNEVGQNVSTSKLCLPNLPSLSLLSFATSQLAVMSAFRCRSVICSSVMVMVSPFASPSLWYLFCSTDEANSWFSEYNWVIICLLPT